MVDGINSSSGERGGRKGITRAVLTEATIAGRLQPLQAGIPLVAQHVGIICWVIEGALTPRSGVAEEEAKADSFQLAWVCSSGHGEPFWHTEVMRESRN